MSEIHFVGKTRYEDLKVPTDYKWLILFHSRIFYNIRYVFEEEKLFTTLFWSVNV